MEDKIDFDELEANALYDAISYKIKSCRWDVTDESDWECLVQLKEIQKRLGKWLYAESK